MLDEGRYASITEMADAEKLDRGHMGRLLQLTLLLPEVVSAILDGDVTASASDACSIACQPRGSNSSVTC